MKTIKLLPGLLLPIGAPASGKTTLATRLVKAGIPAASILGWDTTRAEVCPESPCSCRDAAAGCPGREECYCRAGYVWRLVTSRMTNLATSGSFFYVDGLNLKAADWKKPMALAAEHQLQTTALLFEPLPLEQLKERNASRSRQVPEEVLEQFLRRHNQITREMLIERGFNHVYSVNDFTEFST